MATIYTHADKNIRRTWLLIALFIILIIALGWLFSWLLESIILLVVAVILSFLMSFFTYWYSAKIVLGLSKAKEIKKKENLELYRLVENLCITAGLPLPKIYIIEAAQPNAFATGRDSKHAVIAVTRGLLDKLERRELEGVLAHELSHIGNRDILLGTVVVVLVGIVALLSHWFLRISFFGGVRRRDSKGQAGLIILILGILAIILAPLAAKIIQLAISRRREFLADASGALLTRFPEGLVRALEKISRDQTPLKTASNATAHLYISSPFRGKQSKSWFIKLFMTHPLVEERVKALRKMSV